MQNTKHIIKPLEEGFIIIFGDGQMSGCNAAPGAKVFPTKAHAEIAIDVMNRTNAHFFEEEYQTAIRLH